jgi:exosome complex component RRP42
MGAGFVGGEAGLTGAVRAPRGKTAAQKKGRRGVKGKERQMVVTGKGRAEYVAGPGDDWDLEDLGGGEEGEGELMDEQIRLGLPVCVTLNLVGCCSLSEVKPRKELLMISLTQQIPNTEKYFLDATRQEEIACPSRLQLFFSSRSQNNTSSMVGDLKICGLRIEGGEPIDLNRLPGLLLEGKRIATEMMIDTNKVIS